MSALSIIQKHCRMHALAVPSSVIGSTDTQVAQLLAILQDAIGDIVVQSQFQVSTQIATYVLTAGENQGPMSTIAPFGYYQANFETFFDRTLRRPLYGPVDDTEWQELKALPNPGPFYKFRILNDCLLINPVPTSPFSTIAFEYMSSWAVVDNAGVLKSDITADDDTFILPEQIISKWLSFAWKQIKGLPYQGDQQAAYDQLNNYIAKDKVKARINVSEGMANTIKPGVFVPSGNWPVQ